MCHQITTGTSIPPCQLQRTCSIDVATRAEGGVTWSAEEHIAKPTEGEVAEGGIPDLVEEKDPVSGAIEEGKSWMEL